MNKIVLIGSGNAATCLGKAFYKAGCLIMQVFSRDIKNAELLADQISAQPINSYYDLRDDADLYIIAVPDSYIHVVADEMFNKANVSKSLVVHVSGNTPLNALSRAFSRTGVLYPLQTMTKDKEIDFTDVDIIIDAAMEEDLPTIETVAKKISQKVLHLNDRQRNEMHLSAVFCNNFVNRMYVEAEKISKEAGVPFSIFHSLILETAKKATESSPSEVATGPAVRNDMSTIVSHIQLLEDDFKLKQLYIDLTKRINPEIKLKE